MLNGDEKVGYKALNSGIPITQEKGVSLQTQIPKMIPLYCLNVRIIDKLTNVLCYRDLTVWSKQGLSLTTLEPLLCHHCEISSELFHHSVVWFPYQKKKSTQILHRSAVNIRCISTYRTFRTKLGTVKVSPTAITLKLQQSKPSEI